VIAKQKLTIRIKDLIPRVRALVRANTKEIPLAIRLRGRLRDGPVRFGVWRQIDIPCASSHTELGNFFRLHLVSSGTLGPTAAHGAQLAFRGGQVSLKKWRQLCDLDLLGEAEHLEHPDSIPVHVYFVPS
jgi:hypothetical protein